MKVSGDTLLRLLRKATLPGVATPRVLSIDDWVQRKGRTYATILVDLERHQVVDLLPARTATTLADWLKANPGIEIIVRDRSTEYARGVSEGAPDARQVADRWHLLLNLRQVLERYLTQAYARLKQLPRPIIGGADGNTEIYVPRRLPCAPTRNERRTSQASRERCLALYESVQALKADGQPILRISQQLNLHRATVRKYYYADSFPERSQRKLMPSILDPYLTYLDERLHEGCENASQLWREICAQGYPGTRSQVYKWIQGKRTQPAPSTPKRYSGEAQGEERRELKRLRSTRGIPSAKQLAWLLTKKVEELSKREHQLLAWVRQDGLVAAVSDLAQQFAIMIRERQAELLDTWLAACIATGISNLITFATGIQQDYPAVQAAFSTVWSNGQAEGQVNRLKLVKRQMVRRVTRNSIAPTGSLD
jgi:transposase